MPHGYDPEGAPWDLPVRQVQDEPHRFITKTDVKIGVLVAVLLFVAVVVAF